MLRFRLAASAAAAVSLLLGTGASAAAVSAAAVHPSSSPPRAVTPITPNGSWTVYHHDNGHTGYDSTRPLATSATAGWTSATLDESVYGSPVIYQGVVYVGTLNNTVYALNQTDGSLVWSNHLRAPETGGWACGNVSPQGILGTPVIDPATNRIYAATLGVDDVYRVEGLNLATGAETLNTVVTTPASPGFDWTIEQERGALAVANGNVYVPFGGRAGDCGAYHGYVFAVPTNGGAVTNYHVTGGQGSGYWAAGGVVVDDSTGKVFVTSGNGTAGGCSANLDGTAVFENDAIVRLSSTLALEDAFYPQDWQANWCANDQDLGSASMVLISPTLAFQAGKWGTGFLVNPQSLGGMDGQLFPTPFPATYTEANVCLGNHSDANFGSYAYAAPYVYLSCEGNGMVALQVNTSTPSFSVCDNACAAPSWNTGGVGTLGPPIVAGGVVWAVNAGGGGGLYGFNATTGAQVFHSSGFSARRFTSPSEAGGQIFVSAGTEVRSFNMVSGCSTAGVTAAPPTSQVAGSPVLFTATASGPNCGSPVFEYWLQYPNGTWVMKRTFNSSPTWNWDTTGYPLGNYTVHVWANQSGDPTGTYEALASLSYSLHGCTSAGVGAAPPSPSLLGTQVTFTATSSGCPSPVYEFWLMYPDGTWHMTQGFSNSAVWNWDSTGYAAGMYTVHVWANQAGDSTATFEALGSLNYALNAPVPCATASLSPSNPSAAAGSTVTLIASSTACSNPHYEFWVQYLDGSWHLIQPFGSATFNWNTAGLATGTYTVHVWANQIGDQTGTWEANGSDTVTLTGCTTGTLSPVNPTRESGSTVVLIATADSGCSNPQFEFWVQYLDGTWHMIQPWGGSTFNWNTAGLAPGTYTVHVWGNQIGASTATWQVNVSDTVILSGCTTGTLTPVNPSRDAGSTVGLTATAGGGCSTPQFEFWVQYLDGTWHLIQPWGGAAFNWNTAGLAPGTYTVHVWGNATGASTATWQVNVSDTVILTGCTTGTLTPVSPSRAAGTTVVLTATAGGGCTTPQFEFWVQYLDGTWHLIQGWGGATFNWNTTGLRPGTYTVHVWGNATGASTATWQVNVSDTVILSGCTSATVSPASGTAPVGAKPTFTVTAATCSGTPVYKFWLEYPDGTWHMMRDWGTGNSWQWDSTGFPKGNYVLHVWVNNQGADTSTFEVFGTATYTLT